MSKTKNTKLEQELADLKDDVAAIKKELKDVQAWQHKEMGALSVVIIFMASFARAVLKL